MNIFELTTTAQIKSLKIACIMDEFSYETFRYDCDLLQLTPQDWESELTDFQPQLLLVESAWRGKDNLWANKVFSTSSALPNIVAWCKSRNIPTAFWNKEDPVNFESFTHGMGVTQLFDYIFTTDLDSICRYKKILTHNNVFLLPFTVQPTLHNPIEEYEREDGACFAGSYYYKYPKRAEDFRILYDTILAHKPISIYDRNHTRGDKQFQFPDHYIPSIKGFLPFSEISKGYKGYNYGITLNSVVNSQTMFARRALELIACNTSVISNYSRSLRLFFGEGITMLGEAELFEQELLELFKNESQRNKTKYQLLTYVMQELTAERGLQLIVETIIGRNLKTKQPSICCISPVSTIQELQHAYDNFYRQKHENKNLLIVGNDAVCHTRKADQNITSCTAEQLKELSASLIAENDFVAILQPDDYYGSLYLTDTVLAQKFKPQTITCRNPYHQVKDGKLSLNNEHKAYQWQSEIKTATAVFPTALLTSAQLQKIVITQNWSCDSNQALALSTFNYCRFGATNPELANNVCPTIDSCSFLSMNELHQMALNTSNEFKQVFDLVEFDGNKILKSFTQKKPAITLDLNSSPITLTSTLDPEKHDYINSDTPLVLENLLQDGKLKFWLNASYCCDLLLDIWFYDNDAKDVGRAIYPPNASITYLPPAEAVTVKFALRIKGPGTAELFEFQTGTQVYLPDRIRGMNKSLYISSNENLTSADLKDHNVAADADVFIFSNDLAYEYKKLGHNNVVVGGDLLLASLLSGWRYESINYDCDALKQKLERNLAQLKRTNK